MKLYNIIPITQLKSPIHNTKSTQVLTFQKGFKINVFMNQTT